MCHITCYIKGSEDFKPKPNFKKTNLRPLTVLVACCYFVDISFSLIYAVWLHGQTGMDFVRTRGAVVPLRALSGSNCRTFQFNLMHLHLDEPIYVCFRSILARSLHWWKGLFDMAGMHIFLFSGMVYVPILCLGNCFGFMSFLGSFIRPRTDCWELCWHLWQRLSEDSGLYTAHFRLH